MLLHIPTIGGKLFDDGLTRKAMVMLGVMIGCRKQPAVVGIQAAHTVTTCCCLTPERAGEPACLEMVPDPLTKGVQMPDAVPSALAPMQNAPYTHKSAHQLEVTYAIHAHTLLGAEVQNRSSLLMQCASTKASR